MSSILRPHAHKKGAVSRPYIPAIVLAALLPVAFLASIAFGAVDIPLIDIFRLALSPNSPSSDSPVLDQPSVSAPANSASAPPNNASSTSSADAPANSTPTPSTSAPSREAYSAILWSIRLPRGLASLLAGAALALSGAALQGVFRNPMTSPNILGISAGGSIGAIISIVTGLHLLHSLVLPLSAFLAAMATAGIVYAIGARNSGVLFLILAGLAISSFLSGLISAILLFSQRYEIQQFLFWTMGSLDGVLPARLLWTFPFIVLASLLLLAKATALNLLALGDEQAHSLGLSLRRSKAQVIALAALLTSMSISIAGPIGFVGLLVPHLVRLLLGADHRRLLPLSLLSGAVFLSLCDTLARTVIAPQEVKTGIITSLLGAPYFIFLILRYQRAGGVFAQRGNVRSSLRRNVLRSTASGLVSRSHADVSAERNPLYDLQPARAETSVLNSKSSIPPPRLLQSMAQSTPPINAQGLGYSAGGRIIVRNISFSLKQGEVLGLIGPNGAGKTSILKCLMNFYRYTGRVALAGQELSSISDRERAELIGYLGQSPPEPPAFRVSEVLEMACYNTGSPALFASTTGSPPLSDAPTPSGSLAANQLPPPPCLQTCFAVLAELGLDERFESQFALLSGGEKQLVLFARLLLQNCPVLLLDEPSANLDMYYERKIMRVISEQGRAGRSAIIAIHNLNLAAEFCDRLLLLHKGEVAAIGKPEEVLSQENIQRVYNSAVEIHRHPIHNSPYIVAKS